MISAKEFRLKLYTWAKEHPRDYPWIEEKDPYKIWVSEILLQQTRSDQARPYYLNFIKAFPTLDDLSAAPLDLILRYWQGLGYYSRARNMHASAKMLKEQFDGIFPQDPQSLQKIKGIGPYTAAAIASFAFHYPAAVLDGNVIRVFARLLGIPHLAGNKEEKNEWNRILNTYLDKKNSASYNQALMNFGSIHCKPLKPHCTNCCFQTKCVAFLTESIPAFPAKKEKTILKKRYFHFVLMRNTKKQILLEKRNDNDIWKGLYQLPLIESPQNKSLRTFSLSKIKTTDTKHPPKISLNYLKSQTIKLSHQELYCSFYEARISGRYGKIKPPFSFVNRENLVNFAFPSVIKKFLKEII